MAGVMTLLGVDLGTTHCKAGLFSEDGRTLAVASRPSAAQRGQQGDFFYDPAVLEETLATVIREALQAVETSPVQAVGITSMAETGLLVDRRTGEHRSPLLPWFDRGASPQANRLLEGMDQAGVEERFCKSGIRPTFKCGLAKLLRLREFDAAAVEDSVWLSAADWAAYRLTGEMVTDPSLAGRTYAFNLDDGDWDTGWLERFNLSSQNFPQVRPSGSPPGGYSRSMGMRLPLAEGTPVAVSGHDHLVAAFGLSAATGQTGAHPAFDSMGTAETIFGLMPAEPLDGPAYRSGLSYGAYVLPGLRYWMGGLSASGGSLEWLRAILSDPPLSYENLDDLIDVAGAAAGEILYFPYLTGSGSPHTDPLARGAFIGLTASHGRADLLKAVLEGTAYEMEVIRRAGEAAAGRPISTVLTAGGGTRNAAWMRIKADVSGCRYEIPRVPEAALLGAALLAGLGSGVWPSLESMQRNLLRPEVDVILPDAGRHEVYQNIFERGYLPLQAPLRSHYHDFVPGLQVTAGQAERQEQGNP